MKHVRQIVSLRLLHPHIRCNYRLENREQKPRPSDTVIADAPHHQIRLPAPSDAPSDVPVAPPATKR